MKFKNLPVLLVAIMALGFVFTSCEKEELMTENSENFNEQVTINDLPNLKVEDGVIFFENSEDFELSTKIFIQMNQNEYLEWVKENNFKSLECLYNEAMQSECELTEYYETLTDEQANNIEIKDFTDLTLKYVKEGYLKIVEVDDSSSIAVINSDIPELSRVISPESIVCIGDTAIKYFEGKIIKAPIEKLEYLKNNENDFSGFNVILNSTKGDVTRYFKGSGSSYKIITNTVQKTRALYKCYFRQFHTTSPNFTSFFALEIKYEKYVWGKWRERSTTFTFPSTSYKLKWTYSNGTVGDMTESPYLSYAGNTSHATKYYVHWGYGGNENSYIHTPHIYRGTIKFEVPTVCIYEFRLTEKYALK